MTRYEIILAQLMGNFERKAGCVVDDASDMAIKLKVIAGELSALYDRLDFYENQIYPNTAEGEYLKRHGDARGIHRKTASKSTGAVEFICKTPAEHDILIPIGTLLTSSKSNGVMFQTTNELTIKQGATKGGTFIESVDCGSHTSIAPNFIDILVTPIAGITSIRNPDKIGGGSDEESDQLYRQRIIESYSKISNGANLNYYEQFAKSKGDIWYAKAIFTPGVSNQIQLYVENYTRSISDSTISALQSEIEKVRELGIKVIVSRPVKKRIDVKLNVKVDNLADENSYYIQITELVNEQVQNFNIGQRFSPAIITSNILKIDGVNDVEIITPTSPINLQPNEICQLASALITIERG